MFDAQENKLSMYESVEQHFDSNPLTWATIAAIGTSYNRFKGNIGNIRTLSQTHGITTAGITQTKSNLKRDMAFAAGLVADALHALALDTGNLDLAARNVFNPASALRERENILVPICQRIHADATDFLPALTASYGITAPLLADLAGKIAAFNGKIQAPRNAVAGNKVITGNIAAAFTAADAELEGRLDKLVNLLTPASPESAAWVGRYWILRDVINLHGPGTPVTPPTGAHVAVGYDRLQSNGTLTQIGTRNGAPKYRIGTGDFVTLENTGLNWMIYDQDPDLVGPSATPQYEGGPNLTDPWQTLLPNTTAGTIS